MTDDENTKEVADLLGRIGMASLLDGLIDILRECPEPYLRSLYQDIRKATDIYKSRYTPPFHL